MITPATTTGRASRIRVILRVPRSAFSTTVSTTRLMIHTLAGTGDSYRVDGGQPDPVARAGCGGCTTRAAGGPDQDQAGEPAEALLPVERVEPAGKRALSGPAALDVGRPGSGKILLLAHGRREVMRVPEPPVTFAGLLRQLRAGAGLTQEELAEAASVSVRSVRDLERGRVAAPQKETVRLLADALRLGGAARAGFEAAARSRAARGGVAAATRALPRDIASFTGRQQELAVLMAAATGVAEAGGVVGIHAIGGMAGVGKTAFAVHAAHRLAGRFPGGQIFLPLHGHTPGQQPVDPEDALASLLLTAGVPAAQIPPGLEARMALWRDRLAGRQLLLVLDDAASSEQVLPL